VVDLKLAKNSIILSINRKQVVASATLLVQKKDVGKELPYAIGH